MNLVWLTENYPPQRGGMAQSCDRIVRNLRQTGITIHVVHFTNRNDGLRTIEKSGGSYTAIPTDFDESHILNIAWIKLSTFKNIDGLVCFGGYLSMLGAPVFAKSFNWKLYALFRGNDFDVSIFSSKKRSLLNELMAHCAKVAVVTSDKLKKINQLYPTVSCSFIPNGISQENWQESSIERDFASKWRKEHHINGTDLLCLGLFGQLKPKKGSLFLLDSLESFKLLKRFHLLLIGDVDEELLIRLQESQQPYTHLPFLDRFQLIPYYLCCDLVSLPSFYDGLPNVLLEALSLKIPVIGSRIDGMKDVISDIFPELLFEPGNSVECQKVFHNFIQHSPENRKHIGDTLKQHVDEKFNETIEAKNYHRFFTD